MEVVRLVQGAFMVWDAKMESSLKSDVDDTVKTVSSRANNTNLNEDLAKISYIFSDKTGTFTKNEMKLAKWFVDDIVYDELESPGSFSKAAVDVFYFYNLTFQRQILILIEKKKCIVCFAV